VDAPPALAETAEDPAKFTYLDALLEDEGE